MATLYTFNCTKCDYTTLTAGEPSMIMSGYTVPVVCEKCKEISDELHGFSEDGKVAIESNWKCQDCRGKKYYFWDHVKKPCPKCMVGVLEMDPDGDVVLSD